MEERSENRLTQALYDSTKLMLHNFLIALQTCDMDAELFGQPLWKHCYHTLHSCDQWFINPVQYQDPPFHVEGLNNLDVVSTCSLSRAQLIAYLSQIETKVLTYLGSLHDDDLYELVEGTSFNRLSCIVGQSRHFNCHMGNIHAVTIQNTGKWPLVLGMDALNEPYPEQLFE